MTDESELSLADMLRSYAQSDPTTLAQLLPLQIDDIIAALDEAEKIGEIDSTAKGEVVWRFRRIQDIVPRAVTETVIMLEVDRLLREIVEHIARAMTAHEEVTGKDLATRIAEKIVVDLPAYFAKRLPSQMAEDEWLFIRTDIADTIRRMLP